MEEHPINVAARMGRLDEVRGHVEHDADTLHATMEYTNSTSLHEAAEAGHVEVVRYLLDHGAEVNGRDRNQDTALHVASNEGHVQVVVLLLERGADVSLWAARRFTALMDAAYGGHTEVVDVLLRHGESDIIDATDKENGTALCCAAYVGAPRVVKQLLEAGADPTIPMSFTDDSDDPAGLRTPSEVARRSPAAAPLQEWDRAYLLTRMRRIRESVTTKSTQA